MPSIPRVAVAALLVVACGGDPAQLEARAEREYVRCMAQRGVPASRVEIHISSAGEYRDMNATYTGQGEPVPDSASGACLKEVLDQLSIPYELP